MTTANRIKIMVSSTRKDLMPYREAAEEIIEKIARDERDQWQIYNTSMEDNTQSGAVESAIEVSRRWVAEADWIVLILGWYYGTVPEDGPKGISVTEWEYREAVRLKDAGQNKRIFVFVAGAHDSAVPYREVDTNQVDLKDQMKSAHQDKMDAFRVLVSKQHMDPFRHLGDFTTRLERTLRDAVKGWLPPIPPGSELARLLVSVQPECRACIIAVQQLACCKRIHDHLHTLRVSIVSALRNIDLVLWRDKAELSDRERLQLSRRKSAAVDITRSLEDEIKHLGEDDADLTHTVSAVAAHAKLLDPETVETLSGEQARSHAEEFITAVQQAFTEANRMMQQRKSALDRLHQTLVAHITTQRNAFRLNEDETHLLESQLTLIAENKHRLAEALSHHDAWQNYHDKLEEIYAQLGTSAFEKHLHRFATQKLPGLKGLVAKHKLTPGQHPPVRMRENAGEVVSELRPRLDALESHRDEEDFLAFQGPFDKLFYEVDLGTLAEVRKAETRVENFEAALRQVILSRNLTAG